MFRGGVPEMFVTSYFVTYCIYISKKPGFCFHYYCAVDDEWKKSDTFWLATRVRLFVHYTISLSSSCKLIWRHWNYKMPVSYIFSGVWVRVSIFSQLSIIQYMRLCVFCLPISLGMIERICVRSRRCGCLVTWFCYQLVTRQPHLRDLNHVHFVLLSSSNRKYELISIV